MSYRRYDAVVGGGSVGGLSFAMEAASRGLKVLVLEEDQEVGEPEKCDGLVSRRALAKYIAPSERCIQSTVKTGTVNSPSGRSVTLGASRLDVVVIDRSAYEEQLAESAVSKGAELKTGARVNGVAPGSANDLVVTAGTSTPGSSEHYLCSYYVDATGPSSLVGRKRPGLIPAAKYEVEGDWFEDGRVEVFLNQEKYPGFFAWVIPRGNGLAKVGAAGIGVNSFKTLDSFLSARKVKIRTRVAAPIYLGGPIDEFIVGRTVFVGESAGQVKPTTAGGILASVAGGLMAGRWMSESLAAEDPRLMSNYQREWERVFGKEFKLMKRLRTLYQHLSNDDVEKMVAALSSPGIASKLSSTDFDFHASALLSTLGARTTLQLASVLISVEAKNALTSLVE